MTVYDTPLYEDHYLELVFEDKENVLLGTNFITSPADIDIYRKLKLQDAKISAQHKQQFKELCHDHKAVFSPSSSDTGQTKLIMMDTDTRDSPLIS